MSATPQYVALATDYDGTIARHGDVEPQTYDALRRWKESGRKLILVTGRELPDLLRVFPMIGIFDRVVAENGALIYEPGPARKSVLAPAAPEFFVDTLRSEGVTPLSVGEVIVATVENYRGVVLQTIEQLGIKWKIVLNKGALMAMPVNIDKAVGLKAALRELNVTADDVVGVGDAENDYVFLAMCGYSAAVCNALADLKKEVHFVTQAAHGAGVEELIDKLLQRAAPPELGMRNVNK